MKESRYLLEWNGKKLSYSIRGEGDPVLLLHGGHSNWDEEFGVDELVEAGFSVITPNRPGYGVTSLMTPEDETAHYANLLDCLHIRQVAVIAISAGGPSGIRLAAARPERISSLILQSAVTGVWLTPYDKEYRAAHLLFHPVTERYIWKLLGLYARFAPRALFKQMAQSFSKLTTQEVLEKIDPSDLAAFSRMITRQRSGRGFLLDVKRPSIGEELRRISCPVLVLHDVNDAAVPFIHAERVMRAVETARLVQVDGWGHLIWIGRGARKVFDETAVFLNENSKRTEVSE